LRGFCCHSFFLTFNVYHYTIFIVKSKRVADLKTYSRLNALEQGHRDWFSIAPLLLESDFETRVPRRNEGRSDVKALKSVVEAAGLLGISPWTVRSFIRTGKLKPVRIGRRVLLPETELERLVAESQGPSEVQLRTRNAGEPTEQGTL
jgi:excisionase family DNA binding protein